EVPQPDFVAPDFRAEQTVIRAELDAKGRRTRNPQHLLPGPRVPEPEHAFPAIAGQQIAGVVEGKTVTSVLDPFQLGSFFAGGYGPEPNDMVAADRRQDVAFRVPGSPGPRLEGMWKVRKHVPGFQVADLDPSVVDHS